jgi:hypothetical protein
MDAYVASPLGWHRFLQVAGGLMALLMYVPLLFNVVRDRGVGQSFAMWALWGALDTTITVSLFAQHGNFWLTLCFAAGSTFLAGLLLWWGRVSWGWLETVILFLVAGCLVVWKVSGPRNATIATTLAIVIAGTPGMLELWRNPQPAVARIWAGFTAANLMALFGGLSWSIEERFAPGLFTVQALAMTLVSLRKKGARECPGSRLTLADKGRGAVESP